MIAKELPNEESPAPEPIAVIGLGCRFSGEASSTEGFWEMIRSGRTGHGKVPVSRYDSSAWYHPSHDRKGAINHDSGFFLREDPSLFDAPFFSITAKEAAGMDPAQRLVLEVAYEAFENGGVPMEFLSGTKTAVYSGCMTNDYELLSTRDLHDMPHNSATGNGRTMLANRISWFFDLRGPSVMMDTACSSSLTALHLATQALRNRECEMALVTGASLILDPNFTQRLSYMHMLSADGISHSFDAKANGYGRGEGLGAVLLKPLSVAVADGDAIRAVLRATGVNQDGRTPGITMPSADAQADLINTTYGPGLPSMRETAYCEAHGTGTEIGDPTELSAIGKTLGAARQPSDDPIYIGSVKTNIGHTEGAAGVASLIKTVLCFENAMFVQNAGFSQLNPKIRLEEWHMRLSNDTVPWPSHLPQRTSINSFGFGGSNAHAILESHSEYFGPSPRSTDTSDSQPPVVVVFSTHDKAGISRTSAKWRSFIEKKVQQGQNLSLRDIAHTMYTRRSQLPFRSFAVADSLEDLQVVLGQELSSFPRAKRTNTSQSNLAFVFTGQGAQWAGMGEGLLHIPSFAESIARSQEVLSTLGCPWRIEDEIRADSSSSRINQPDRSQVICCALQIALVELLASWGVHPKATVGHSSGEIGAAYAAGFLNHQDAISIAYYRGILSIQLSQCGRQGRMMAVGLSVTEVQSYIKQLPDQSVVVACDNSPSSTTVSGDKQQIDILEQILRENKHFARKLRVETAYHSPHMLDIAAEYEQSIQSIQPEDRHENRVAMFSSVTKERIYSKDMIASYWVQNMVSRVEFTAAVTQVLQYAQPGKGRRRAVPVKWSGFLEIGPHESLKGPFQQTLQSVSPSLSSLPYTALILRNKDAHRTSLEAAGTLWAIGSPINLTAVNQTHHTKMPLKVVSDLPSYAWNHQSSFWHESVSSVGVRRREQPRHDILGVPISYNNSLEPRWRNFLRVSEIPWLNHHIVAGSIIFPAAGMVTIVAEAAKQIADSKQSLAGIEFHELKFVRGMVIPPDERGLETLLSIKQHSAVPGWYEFGLFSLADGSSWIQHAKGEFSMHYEDGNGHVDGGDWDATVRAVHYTQAIAVKADVEALYEWLGRTGGVTLGPSFRSIKEAFFCPNKGDLWISGLVQDTESTMPHERESPYFMHPTALDALFQAAVLSRSDALSNQNANIPVAVERLYLPIGFGLKAGDRFSVHTTTYDHGDSLYSNCIASDAEWSKPQVMLQGVRLGRVPVQNETLSKKERLNRYSALTWQEHVNSFHEFGARTDRKSTFQEWIDRITYTHGDTQALFVIKQGTADDMVKRVQCLAPHVGPRPHIGHLTVAISGSNPSERVDISSLQTSISEVNFVWLDAPDAIDPSVLGDNVFDLVVLDDPDMFNIDSNGASSILGSAAKPEAWLIIRDSNSSMKKGIDMVESSGWITRSPNPDAGFVVLHRELTPRSMDSTIYVLAVNQSNIPDHLLRCLVHTFAAEGSQIQLVGVSDIPTLVGKAVISLLEIQSPWISRWTEDDFVKFKALLRAKYILWVSPIAENGTADHAEFGASTGLFRSLRNEQRDTILAQAQFDVTGGMNYTELAYSLLQIMWLTFLSNKSGSTDFEFRVREGRILVPRVIANEPVGDAIYSMAHGPEPKQANLMDGTRPLWLRNSQLDAENHYWEINTDLEDALAADQIEIQLQLQTVPVQSQNDDQPPETRVHAIEAVGVIRQVGSEVGDGFLPGDFVALLYAGEKIRIANRVRVPLGAVTKLQPDADLIQAVSMPVAYTLAYMSLFDTVRKSQTSSVLVVGSMNQTLRAIVDCGLASGLDVYVALDTIDSVNQIQKQYSSISEKAFLLRSGLPSQIYRLTGGKGVEVTISSLGGSAARIAAQCLATGGSYVNLSGGINMSSLPTSFTSRGCSFSSLQLRGKADFQTEKVLESFRQVFKLLSAQHIVQPYPNFAVSEISGAFNHSRNFRTRVIVNLDAPGMVPILPAPVQPIDLPKENTYVLAGGLGTIGMALSEVLVSRGAKNLVFLSRSGTPNNAQQIILQRFNDAGCYTHVRCCDITEVEDVQSLLSEAKIEGWKIKGIIQCATVLKDAMFEKMKFEEWKLSTNSKIRGTLNLHHLFPSNLDFFITLSSVASLIGNIGQSNYAAGNAFMDDLMSWRRSHNLCGQSINIGLVPDASGTGDVAESSEQRQERYSHLEGTEITIEDLKTLLHVILQDGSSIPPQLVAGMKDNLPRKNAALWQLDRKFDHRIRPTGEDSGSSPAQTVSLLKNATTIEDATAIITQALQAYLGKSMAAEAESIDTELPLSALGVDSLRAVEVQNWVSIEAGAELSSFEFLGSQPLRILAEKIAAQSSFVVAT
ncbi:hypothetical protein PENVUL_c039G09862 [Penicillium vulpinum]|uniref:Uncharacterized protein n=1 Tax=Penicillium vulpinum TaxID=29845 RepID=A0A1V6RLJ6_9EURO|nr:hypothetical protein PENVUL_c039G09862 [Penicillium vulpinum]